jgi:tetratricopeptide (TPR) repeat protein
MPEARVGLEGAAEPARWLAGWVCAIFLLALGQVATFPWVWDDKTLLRDSALLATPGSLPTALRLDFWALSANPRASGMYRPVATASYYLDRWLFGRSSVGPHLVNLGLHAACALLLWRLARRLGLGEAGAVLAAGLFALHPVVAEAVANVTSRTDVLATFWVLLALRGARTARGPAGWVAVSVAAWLACLSKESALVGVALGLGLEWAAPTAARPRLLPVGLAFALPAAAALGVRTYVLGSPVRLDGAGSALLGAASTLRYFGLFLWPSPLVPYQLPTSPSALALVALLAGAVALAAVLLRLGQRLPLVGVGWAVVALAPVAGWLPVTVRFSGLLDYLPLAGVALAVGPLLARLRAGAAAFALGALGLACGLQAARFGSDLALWTANVEATPELAPPRLNLGNALGAEGDLEGARQAWGEAARLAQGSGDGKSLALAHLALGNADRDSGHLEAAAGHYRASLEASSRRLWQAAVNLALLLSGQGQGASAQALLEDQYRHTPVAPVAELGRGLARAAGDLEAVQRWEQAARDHPAPATNAGGRGASSLEAPFP